jgi:hypothetical protein
VNEKGWRNDADDVVDGNARNLEFTLLKMMLRVVLNKVKSKTMFGQLKCYGVYN